MAVLRFSLVWQSSVFHRDLICHFQLEFFASEVCILPYFCLMTQLLNEPQRSMQISFITYVL